MKTGQNSQVCFSEVLMDPFLCGDKDLLFQYKINYYSMIHKVVTSSGNVQHIITSSHN